MYSLVFKRWVFSRSYVFIGNWVKDFVTRRGLRKGDEIGLQWNPFKNAFELSVLQVNYGIGTTSRGSSLVCSYFFLLL